MGNKKVFTLNKDEFLEKFNLCGCTSIEIINAFENVINDLTKELSEKIEKRNYNSYYTAIAERHNLDKFLVELILLLLNEKGYAMHGSAARGSWVLDYEMEKLKEIGEFLE